MAQDLNRSIKVYIDNSDAMSKAQALESKISNLRGELERLNAQGKKDSKDYIATEKALKKLEITYGNYQDKIQETERVLKNLSGATRGELESVRKQLLGNLKKTERGTVEYTEKLKVYHRVQKEIAVAQKEVNSQLGSQGTFMSRAANGFNKYFGMLTTGLAALTGISFTFRKLSQDAAEYDDIYSDVMKTTGMTKEEVLDLNETFKKMDTRTAREDLNEIAEAGGRIGIAKEDIDDFAESMNIVNVALGDSFTGGVEEISTKLGKLKNLFQETKEMEVGDAYIKIGSAVNELGANGAASEQNIADFTLRIGSLPDALKPSVAEALALGAAFEESGIEAEIASRSYGIVLQRASTHAEKFAKIMGLTTQGVKDLINEDPLEFFLKFSETMKGMDATTTAETLKYLKINADGANKVIGAAANNTDRFRELLLLSNDAFREGTSVINEYNIKNNNAAAELEKRKKSFKDAAESLGNRLNPALLKSTSYLTYMVKLLPGFLDFLGKYGKYILYLGTVYAVYVGGIKLSVLWNDKLRTALALSNIQLKFQNALMITGRVGVLSYNIVIGLLTGNITRMRAAWKLLNATMATSPMGLAMAAVAALAGAFILLHSNMSRARSEKQALNKISKDVTRSTAEERAQLDMLLATAKNEKLSKDQRAEAIKKLNELSPEYLGNITLENINTKETTRAVNEYTAALKINAQQKAISDKMSELYGEKMGKEMEISQLNQKIEEDKAKGLLRSNILMQSAYAARIWIIQKSLDGVNQEIEAYATLGQTIEQANKPKNKPVSVNPVLDPDSEDSPGGGGLGVPDAEEDKNKYKKKLAELEKYINEEKNKLAQARIDGLMTQYEYDRQLELLETERLAKMLEIYEIDSEKKAEIENLLFNHKLEILKKIEDEEKSFQEELFKQQKKQAEAKKKVDEERAKNNLKALQLIAKQNEENYKKEFERENKRRADLIGIGMDFSNEMGELLGGALTGNEDMVASSLKSIINMGLDLLKVQVQMAIAGATAQSLAQPDSIATFGASGLARAAILVGLIEAAFAAVKSVIGNVIGKTGKNSSTSTTSESASGSRVVSQRAAGKYDVIGSDDGRHYRGVPFIGPVQTGFVSTPTLMGEQGGELVVSAPDLSRLQRHINYPLIIRAINDVRTGFVPQRASGNYSNITAGEPSAAVSGDPAIFSEIRDLLLFLKTNPLKAYVLLTEIQRQQELLNNSQNIGKK